MKRYKAKNNHLEFFIDMEAEATAERFNKWEINCLQDSGMGESLEDIIQSKGMTVIQSIDSGEKESANKSFMNLLYGLDCIYKGVSHKGSALACMCKSINDIETNDLSVDGLLETSKKICKMMSKKQLDDLFETVKKKYNFTSKSEFKSLDPL